MTKEKAIVKAALEWEEARRSATCTPSDSNTNILLDATVALMHAVKEYRHAIKNR
jgi:hypothetical protein